MFFKQIYRNSKKNRKDNGLFFGSLIIAIVSFYTLLSLEDQDVMIFLKTIESDAVGKLMLLIPIVYMVSLFFVFFLVYFAYKYQLDNRKKEFGLYLMFGMKRSRLFFLLMGETFWNSILSLILGLPIALFLTEGISLATVKMVGLGIIGHNVSFSLTAVLGTTVGFVAVQMSAMLFLSSQICRKEPLELIRLSSVKKQVSLSAKTRSGAFIVGLVFLVSAYVMGISRLKSFNFASVLLTLILGGVGTFLFYRGLGAFIGNQIRKKSSKQNGLAVFTSRQIQENVVNENKALAVASLLLLMAIACVSFGIGVAADRTQPEGRTADFSIKGEAREVEQILNAEGIRDLISTYYPMYLGTMYESGTEVYWDNLYNEILRQPETNLRNNIMEILPTRTDPYLIPLTSYNELLQSVGKKSIALEENQVALYTSMQDSSEFIDIFNSALASGGHIQIDGEKREYLPEMYHDNIVSDRTITIYLALIVTDADYLRWSDNIGEPLCWNVLMSHDIIKDNGLIQALQMLNEKLYGTGLEYESYINGVGRNLFYTVASSYLAIYLGILFMIIANTVIGLKYLMQQRAGQRRYVTLLMLGAKIETLCQSAGKQIRLFFLLVLSLAACSSIFAVWAMFTSFLKPASGALSSNIFILAAAAFVLLVFIEFVYIYIVIRTSHREIRALQFCDKGEE